MSENTVTTTPKSNGASTPQRIDVQAYPPIPGMVSSWSKVREIIKAECGYLEFIDQGGNRLVVASIPFAINYVSEEAADAASQPGGIALA